MQQDISGVDLVTATNAFALLFELQFNVNAQLVMRPYVWERGGETSVPWWMILFAKRSSSVFKKERLQSMEQYRFAKSQIYKLEKL